MSSNVMHPPLTPDEKRPRTEDAGTAAPAEPPLAYPTADTDAVAYERQYVHDVYSAISDHFSGTRYKGWPRVNAFLEALPPFALVADVGCGNGKYFAAAQRLPAVAVDRECGGETPPALVPAPAPAYRYVVGVDYSEELLRSTQRPFVDPNMHNEQAHHPTYRSKRARKVADDAATPVSSEVQPRTDTVRSDALRSPLRGGLFDAAISIAVIHHYASHERRVGAVRELLRLARPHGGLVLIYVWAREQTGRVKRPVDPETGDGLVRWERNQKYDEAQKVFHRYYHFFAKGELEQLCRAAGSGEDGIPAAIKASYFDKENWCVVLERV